MMQKDCTGADQVLILSLKQSIRRIGFWIRVCVWWLMLSLLVVTIPPALAGLYYAVREGLRDPFELTVKPREAFLRGVGLHARRSYVLTLINLAFLGIIVFAFVFWFTREDAPWRAVAVLAICFFIYWWLCQPFLLPLLIEQPALNAWQVYRAAIRLVAVSPFYAFAITLANTVLSVFGILLLGPSLLYIPTLMALVSIQALWGMTCTEIPDLMDPVAYAEQQHNLKKDSIQNITAL